MNPSLEPALRGPGALVPYPEKDPARDDARDVVRFTAFAAAFERPGKGNLWRRRGEWALTVSARGDGTCGWCLGRGDHNTDFSPSADATEREAPLEAHPRARAKKADSP
jgi:hypothetical protein